MALVGLEDGQGDLGRLGHAPQPGPGHEPGQVHGVGPHRMRGQVPHGHVLQPVTGDAGEPGPIVRVARDHGRGRGLMTGPGTAGG